MTQQRVAVIGAGISGIAAARVLQKNGYTPVVFEKAEQLGGVWAVAYPDVRLQNISAQYHLSDYPWPFTPDLHPTAAQIRAYLESAVQRFAIDVRLGHDITALEQHDDGWRVHGEKFAHAIIATGQYTEGKHRPCFPGEADFAGTIMTERELRALGEFDGRRVVVLGFGKSAVDMASMAAPRARSVHQVFRTPRWMIPQRILGVHFTFALFNRFGTVMMPSWAHPTRIERWLHGGKAAVVGSFWNTIAAVFRMQIRAHAKRGHVAAAARLARVLPEHELVPDLRSAAALAPAAYYRQVADGSIEPVRGEIARFDRAGVVLKSGQTIACDVVCLCTGSTTPVFPFLARALRAVLEAENDGPQLYRHLVHPRLPNLGFAGFNHGYMHVPAVEVGTLWLCALWPGELELPSAAEQEQSIAFVREWKRRRIHFEPSRSCAINTRFQQYIDILLADLGVSPYRKLPNVPAEIFARYRASDYAGVSDEYARASAVRKAPRRPLAVHT